MKEFTASMHCENDIYADLLQMDDFMDFDIDMPCDLDGNDISSLALSVQDNLGHAPNTHGAPQLVPSQQDASVRSATNSIEKTCV